MATEDPYADPVLFARQVLKVEPFEHTIAALRSKAEVVCVVGGRRSGKTFASQLAAIHCAFTHRGGQVIVVGPNTDAQRRFIAETAALLEGSELARGAVVDIEALKIEFSNGATIFGVPPTGGRTRGYGRDVHMCIIDEAGFTPSGLWRDLRYTTADNKAPTWMIGSPWENGFFRQTYESGLDGDPGVHSERWTTDQNPDLSPVWLAQQRARINELEQMVEFDGVFPDVSTKLFPGPLLDRAVAAGLELPSLSELVGPARGVASWDFGVSFDCSVCWTLFRVPMQGLNPGHDKPVFIGWPAAVYEPGTPLTTVCDEAVACRSPFLHLSLEPNGCGAMPTQSIHDRIKGRPDLRHHERRVWWMDYTTAQSKVSSYGLTRWMLENEQLILPPDPRVRREFAAVDLEQTGKVASIGATGVGQHDDIPDACARSMLPSTTRSGRSVCVLQNLLGATAPPDAPVGDELDLEVTETGSGLKLYQRPVLQSVADIRVSVPSGAGQKQWRNPEFDAAREEIRAAINPPQEKE